MTDPYLLLMLFVSFGITMIIARIREHWTEFGVCLFVAFFSLFGLIVNLL